MPMPNGTNPEPRYQANPVRKCRYQANPDRFAAHYQDGARSADTNRTRPEKCSVFGRRAAHRNFGSGPGCWSGGFQGSRILLSSTATWGFALLLVLGCAGLIIRFITMVIRCVVVFLVLLTLLAFMLSAVIGALGGLVWLQVWLLILVR